VLKFANHWHSRSFCPLSPKGVSPVRFQFRNALTWAELFNTGVTPLGDRGWVLRPKEMSPVRFEVSKSLAQPEFLPPVP